MALNTTFYEKNTICSIILEYCFTSSKKCGFIDGLQEGNCIFFYENGQKKWDLNWKKGKLDGNYIAYFEKEKAKGVYKKGRKVGEWVYYDQSGSKTGTETYNSWKGDVYSDESENTYFKNEKIIRYGKFVNGKERQMEILLRKWKTAV
ncbi:hypothetical protein ACM39_01895 [Chryseobacterium sp. FH2]|uniref:toxin-antitoxin system YwqK family antitoxin n=1 Tax=Chryseobacterium sp. FH2 TaxID=1674291 RepID=UPI00065ABE5D|nr:hypothetical protein [Chryseobacterium sp. FH2]KMQ69821.1 hypothetical protein ACM39_01895 [Chryseobacterium sp. FH2]